MQYAVKTVSSDSVKLEKFEEKDDADASLQTKKGKLAEGDRVNLHKCYHDEDPIKSCEVIEEWQNSGGSIEGGVKS